MEVLSSWRIALLEGHLFLTFQCNFTKKFTCTSRFFIVTSFWTSHRGSLCRGSTTWGGTSSGSGCWGHIWCRDRGSTFFIRGGPYFFLLKLDYWWTISFYERGSFKWKLLNETLFKSSSTLAMKIYERKSANLKSYSMRYIWYTVADAKRCASAVSKP